MGLNSALQIGRTGLLTHQQAVKVAGNNLANAATRGYHRQTIALSPTPSSELRSGQFVGTGVQVAGITRQVNEALEDRLRNSISDEYGSLARKNILDQIETIQAELGDNNLSSILGDFFNAWSELSNNPQDNALRSLVIQEGGRLASFTQELREGFTNLRTQVDEAISNAGRTVDNLLTRVAELNRQIAVQEKGSGGAGGLRDQRDLLLQELSQFMDISTNEQPNGVLDVFVGSLPVVLNNQSRGVEVDRTTVNGEQSIKLRIREDGSILEPQSGEFGALLESREQDVQGSITFLDDLINETMFQVNKTFSSGQGLAFYDSITATNRVIDTSVALNDSATELDFTPSHGAFTLHVTQSSTGLRTSERINIDLDGIGGSDTSLQDLQAAIDGVDNISASITTDGRLTISADSGDFEVSFSDDTSGVLATLGINTFFTGGHAGEIAVNPTIEANPSLVAAAQDHLPGDNRNALAMLGLRDAPQSALGGLSITEAWSRRVETVAVETAKLTQRAQADAVVRENLEQQQQAISGVNTDEEAINLLSFQRAYQASARFLQVVDELMDTLLATV